MPKKIILKNSQKTRSVSDFIQSLPPDMKSDAKILLDTFSSVIKTPPKMWGDSMIGFGEYDYERSNGDYGTYFATGFAMRKSGSTVYIMPGYTDYSDILKNLGPFKLGKSCLYIKKIADIHLPTLKKLIRAGLRDLKKTHTVRL